MKRFKKALHRIRANASATRERLRGKLVAKRESNKVTASEVPASEVWVSGVSYQSVQPENVGLGTRGPGDSAIPNESNQVVHVVPTPKKTSYI